MMEGIEPVQTLIYESTYYNGQCYQKVNVKVQIIILFVITSQFSTKTDKKRRKYYIKKEKLLKNERNTNQLKFLLLQVKLDRLEIRKK